MEAVTYFFVPTLALSPAFFPFLPPGSVFLYSTVKLAPFSLFPSRPSHLGLFGAPLQTPAPEKQQVLVFEFCRFFLNFGARPSQPGGRRGSRGAERERVRGPKGKQRFQVSAREP